MSRSFQNVQKQSRAQREEAFTAKSNGVNVMDGGAGGEAVSDQLKALSAVCSHFNDLEIKEGTTKADGADPESVDVAAAPPRHCIHLFTCACQRSRA